jgi:hypothetical protein
LKRTDAASPHQENATEDKSADDFATVLRQTTERSIREIENLIDELHGMRKQLKADCDLIERAIERHSQNTQGVMQLTTTIAENVKRLPHPSS